MEYLVRFEKLKALVLNFHPTLTEFIFYQGSLMVLTMAYGEDDVSGHGTTSSREG